MLILDVILTDLDIASRSVSAMRSQMDLLISLYNHVIYSPNLQVWMIDVDYNSIQILEYPCDAMHLPFSSVSNRCFCFAFFLFSNYEDKTEQNLYVR